MAAEPPALEVAAAMGPVDLMEYLLAQGAYFGSAMHYAAAAGQSASVAKLQHDEYWYAWVRGYDQHGQWSDACRLCPSA